MSPSLTVPSGFKPTEAASIPFSATTEAVFGSGLGLLFLSTAT